jgi:hypothetical protein
VRVQLHRCRFKLQLGGYVGFFGRRWNEWCGVRCVLSTAGAEALPGCEAHIGRAGVGAGGLGCMSFLSCPGCGGCFNCVCVICCRGDLVESCPPSCHASCRSRAHVWAWQCTAKGVLSLPAVVCGRPRAAACGFRGQCASHCYLNVVIGLPACVRSDKSC